MNPTTSVEGVLKSVWTKEILDEQMNTLRKDMNRQLYQGSLPLTYPIEYTMPIHLDMSPSAVKMRKVRQLELEQRVAKMKRGNKPSYRQRQRNARAAKG